MADFCVKQYVANAPTRSHNTVLCKYVLWDQAFHYDAIIYVRLRRQYNNNNATHNFKTMKKTHAYVGYVKCVWVYGNGTHYGTSYRHSSSSAVWSLSHVNVVIFVVVVTTTVVIYIHIIHYIFLEQRRETLSYIQYYLIIHMVGATIVFQWRQRDDHIDTCCNVNYKQI